MALSDQFPNSFPSHMGGYFSKHDVFFICKNLQRYLFMWNIIFMILSRECFKKQQIVKAFMVMFAKPFFWKNIQFSCPVSGMYILSLISNIGTYIHADIMEN